MEDLKIKDGAPAAWCRECGNQMKLIDLALKAGWVWICVTKQCRHYGLVKTFPGEEFKKLAKNP